MATLTGCPPPDSDPTPPPSAATSPGVNVTITDIEIPFDRKPVVHLTIEDDKGNRIPKNELTDGRFILAFLDEFPTAGSTSRFESYTTSTEDPDGVPGSGDEVLHATWDGARLSGFTENEDGTYTYQFEDALPAGFSMSATHQLGGQFRRTSPIDDLSYRTNAIFAFRPDDTKQQVESRNIVETETCNECHTRLSIHGDVRREVQLCILCHSPQSVDGQSGNTVDFPEMIHKIHRGADLPSVQDGEPYHIFGFRNSEHDYSDVVFPQDIRNCTVCHQNSKGSSDANVFLTHPTLEGCASCHDRSWFGNPKETPEGFANHVGGQQVDNSLCALCHPPMAPGPAPIMEAHLLPTDSDAAPGLDFEITDVDVVPTKAGNALDITFFAEDRDGTLWTDLSMMSIVAATLAYPVEEYENAVRETIASSFGGPDGTLTPNDNGSFTYRFDAELPMVSDDTFAVALEGRVPFEFRDEGYNQGTASNARKVFTLAKGEPLERRAIVSEEKCNVCHSELRFHGELRTGVEFCVMCHNPNATDIARRPDEEFPPATVNFKDMIHKIHRGENLEMDYTVYGFGNTPHDFTHVRFPGELQECSICHINGSENVPLPEEALSTWVSDSEKEVSEKLPERAACVSCHDGVLAETHALLNTDFETGIESCAVCHGEDADFAVEVIHMLSP
jgi:OmcA/MtrC family decaheme c-type cytochrome